MRRALVHDLICPDDRSPLAIDRDSAADGERLEQGTLICSSCGAKFPIERGIPSILPRSLRAADSTSEAMRRELALRDEESELYDRLYDDASYRFEIETYVRRLNAASGETILDVGCGTGRITKEYVATAGRVVGADFSLASLGVLRDRLPVEAKQRVDLVQCEVGHLPFRDSMFDAAVSTSLFSNVPTQETRDAGLAEVARVLGAGSRALITVYNHSWLKRIRQRLGLSRSGLKQGCHSDGRVSYYNFDPEEFSGWVGPAFVPGPCFGLNHRVPVLSNLSPRLAVRLDRWLSSTPGSLRVFAKEMGMLATRNPPRGQ